MARDELDLGRFSEPALLVMVSLADGPKHGYAMIEDIERLYGVRLGPGTLYGVISRLEQRGLIVPLATQDRRRPYKLTAAGASAVRAQLRGLRDFVATGLARLRTT
jgi:DNA-binding PadR family transcriptional regulator